MRPFAYLRAYLIIHRLGLVANDTVGQVPGVGANVLVRSLGKSESFNKTTDPFVDVVLCHELIEPSYYLPPGSPSNSPQLGIPSSEGIGFIFIP